MKILYEGKRLMAQWKHDYQGWLSKRGYNWTEYTLINVRFEHNRMFGQVELELGLLGFNVNISYIVNEKQFWKETNRLLKKANSDKTKWVEWK